MGLLGVIDLREAELAAWPERFLRARDGHLWNARDGVGVCGGVLLDGRCQPVDVLLLLQCPFSFYLDMSSLLVGERKGGAR